MAKSNARKTADVIHNIPEYFGPQVDEPEDVMKKGDLWFESDGSLRFKSLPTVAPKSLQKRTKKLKRVEKTLRKMTGKLPVRTRKIEKLRRR